MQPKVSLSSSHVPITRPYNEPGKPTLHTLILSIYYAFQAVSFLVVVPLTACMHFLFSPFMSRPENLTFLHLITLLMKLLIMQFYAASCYLPPRPYPEQTLFTYVFRKSCSYGPPHSHLQLFPCSQPL
jgi:hypothetical protein